jgi:Ca-activated chloride channel family protein
MEMSEKNYIPRDMVLVLDTSGSMAGAKIEQAKKSLKLILDTLKPQDRFGILNFSTTVNKYRDSLTEANAEHIANARTWVDKLLPRGGTAINDALAQALEMRTSDTGRTFTVIFFTDGQPTIGETDTDRILKNVQAKNTANTRIFTFGVGETDGINAAFLDQLSENTRAISTFVRPAEDIAVKTSGLVNKISHPVLANLKLSVVGDKVSLNEIYPPQLPDLFHGGQVTVFGRYTGNGQVAIKLTGSVGAESREFVYETTFVPRSTTDKGFVEDLWARRKVGFLLDQIRLNGEKSELVDEVKNLAKRYGIATPYTSYLVVPDSVSPVAGRPVPPGAQPRPEPAPRALQQFGQGGGAPGTVAGFAKDLDKKAAEGKGDGKAPPLGDARGRLEEERAAAAKTAGPNAPPADDANKLREAHDRRKLLDEAKDALQRRDRQAVQIEKLGVELSVQVNQLRNQDRLQQTAQRRAANRTCIEIGGVWIDEGYTAKMPSVVVKAMSDAYFRILEKQPQMREVFRLGNYLIWVAPNGTALMIDANDGRDQLSDAEIDALFLARR